MSVAAYPPSDTTTTTVSPTDSTFTTTTTTTTTTTEPVTTTPLADTGSEVGDAGLVAAVTLSAGLVVWLVARRWKPTDRETNP